MLDVCTQKLNSFRFKGIRHNQDFMHFELRTRSIYMAPFMVLFIVTLIVPMFSATMVIQFQDILMDARTTHRLQPQPSHPAINCRASMPSAMSFMKKKSQTPYLRTRPVYSVFCMV